MVAKKQPAITVTVFTGISEYIFLYNNWYYKQTLVSDWYKIKQVGIVFGNKQLFSKLRN